MLHSLQISAPGSLTTTAPKKSLFCQYPNTAPVGSFPQGKSRYGVADVAGNVWEWVADWYSPDYYGLGEMRDPRGPESGAMRIVPGSNVLLGRLHHAPSE